MNKWRFSSKWSMAWKIKCFCFGRIKIIFWLLKKKNFSIFSAKTILAFNSQIISASPNIYILAKMVPPAIPSNLLSNTRYYLAYVNQAQHFFSIGSIVLLFPNCEVFELPRGYITITVNKSVLKFLGRPGHPPVAVSAEPKGVVRSHFLCHARRQDY